MKKGRTGAILFGTGMGMIWSVVFTQVLKSAAGIGVGVCFGIAFAFLGASLFKEKDK